MRVCFLLLFPREPAPSRSYVAVVLIFMRDPECNCNPDWQVGKVCMSLGTRRRLSRKDKAYREWKKLANSVQLPMPADLTSSSDIAASLPHNYRSLEIQSHKDGYIQCQSGLRIPIPPSLPVHPQLACWLPFTTNPYAFPRITTISIKSHHHSSIGSPAPRHPTIRDSCHRSTSSSSHDRASCFDPSISGVAGRRQAAWLTPAEQ